MEQQPGASPTLHVRRSDGATWSPLPPWTLRSGAPGAVTVAVVGGAVVAGLLAPDERRRGLDGAPLILRRWDGAGWADLPTDTHGWPRTPTRCGP